MSRCLKTLRAARELRTLSYTEDDWDAEIKVAELVPCRRCGRTFFYRAYRDGNRRYSLCKFCGLYQEPGERAVQAKPCAHRCSEQRYLLGMPYIQWHPEGDKYTCFDCRREGVRVAETLVPNLYLTPCHPWRVFPEDLSAADLSSFLNRLRQEADFRWL